MQLCIVRTSEILGVILVTPNIDQRNATTRAVQHARMTQQC